MNTPARSVRRILLGGGALALLLSLCVDVAMLVVPIYDMQLYDRVLLSRNMDTLAMLSIACCVGLLFYGAFEFLRSACFVAIGSLVARQLYSPALAEGLRCAAAGDKRAGPQIARDVGEIRSFLASGAVAVPLDTICTSLFVAVLFVLHPAFGWLAVVGISGLMIAGVIAEEIVHPGQKAAHERRRLADHALSRSLADIELVDGLGMLPAIARRWTRRYGQALHGLSAVATRAHWVGGLSRTYRLGLQSAVMMIGAILVVEGKTTPGALMGANLLLNKAMNPFDHLVGSARQWMMARDAWRRIASMLDRAPAIVPRPAARSVSDGLIVQDADVRLPNGTLLLQGMDFRLEPGTLALLSGPNGTGKTSLLRALAGLVAPSRGAILLDGRPIDEGSQLGYLPQAVELLEGDIGLNIGRMQPDISGAMDAARRAGLHEAIGRMSRGYETKLTGNGSILSGGMRQRVGFARALYGGPRLLLLDEPDASLDTDGTAALVRALRAACDGGAIAVVVSHRSTFKQAADVIIELRERTATLRAESRPAAPRVTLETA